MQTSEAEAVEAKVTVATEEKEREEVESQKERSPPARLSACGSSARPPLRVRRRLCVCAGLSGAVKL